MYGKKKPPTLCESVGGGLVPEKTVDYSYLYYYITLRDNVQGQKAERKPLFGLVWNSNKPTTPEGVT